MKTRKMNLTLWSLLGLAALALIMFAAVDDAEATVRVKAKVRTPYGVIHVDNGPAERYRNYRRPHLPVQRYVEVRITKRDRKVAKRLAWYTGVSKREILQLKRHGYRWAEIGRWLELPRKVVRAAQDQRSWKRFLREGRRYDSCRAEFYWENDRDGGRYGDDDYRDGRVRRGSLHSELGRYQDDD